MFSKDLHTKIKETIERLGEISANLEQIADCWIYCWNQDEPKKKVGCKFTLNRAQALAIRREKRKADEIRKLTAQKVKELWSI